MNSPSLFSQQGLSHLLLRNPSVMLCKHSRKLSPHLEPDWPWHPFFLFSSPLSREIVFLCIHHNSTWSDLTSFPFLLKQSISTLVFLISPSLPSPALSHHETLSLEVHPCAVYKLHHLCFFLLPPHTFSLSSPVLSHWSFFKLKSLHIIAMT